jgi:hypothetical protein
VPESIVCCIGNMTLLEMKNTNECSHKGNSSIGNKSFDKKKESYKKSASKITNDLSKYTSFDESTVLERNRNIVNRIEKSTRYCEKLKKTEGGGTAVQKSPEKALEELVTDEES